MTAFSNKNDLLTFSDWSSAEMNALLDLALDVKARPENYNQALANKNIVAIFEKPSLRTRVSFDIGINKLGGHLVYVDSQGAPLKDREDPVDVGANLACWADGIVSRVYEHKTLVDLAQGAKVPVINALCDLYHPCQALADYLGMAEKFGSVKGKTMAYVGDGNNVTHSLLIVGALLGCNQVVITPKGFEISPNIAQHAAKLAYENNVDITISNSIDELEKADIIYTDTWLSMGDDTPLADIKEKFAPYQVNEALMQKTNASFVMHCQPAHRDLEITSSLMDSDKSLLMLQAENRMHAQNAIMVALIGKQDS
ncbi:ornithine carbamoyltransferase [Glaciecola sp. MH2013]|uniref:ornithine carbamoyltransferase n=1 Tax=Glaciecola sp. MH2013 TaxID=2785524 RepID=UPI0018A0D125|nr:ornithine carbamoyltransferase [Glaciecola sp. MH2013]MBF7073783.1 ornithine carbamoyltransferase [Glaciecola sp. MH2013]